MTDARTLQKRDKYIPTWETDDDSKNCRLCQQEFGVINRRHHCRTCGRLICGNCSAFREIKYDDEQGGDKTKDKRVCKPCFDYFKNYEEVDVRRCVAAATTVGKSAAAIAAQAVAHATAADVMASKQPSLAACMLATIVARQAAIGAYAAKYQAANRPAHAAAVSAATTASNAAKNASDSFVLAAKQPSIAAGVAAATLAAIAARAAADADEMAAKQPTKAAFTLAASVAIKAAFHAAYVWIDASKQPSLGACVAAVKVANQAAVCAIAANVQAVKRPAEASLNFGFWASYLGTLMFLPTWKRRYVSY
jgi:hypothetical protein